MLLFYLFAHLIQFVSSLCLHFFPTVIRAKISGEKIVSPSNSSSPYMKMIQYEIKMIKVGRVNGSISCGYHCRLYAELRCALCAMRREQYVMLQPWHLTPHESNITDVQSPLFQINYMCFFLLPAFNVKDNLNKLFSICQSPASLDFIHLIKTIEQD